MQFLKVFAVLSLTLTRDNRIDWNSIWRRPFGSEPLLLTVPLVPLGQFRGAKQGVSYGFSCVFQTFVTKNGHALPPRV